MIHFVLNLCSITSLHPRASSEIPNYPILDIVVLLTNKKCGFSSENGYTHVTRNIPHYIRHPKTGCDWGTCLFCHNPELILDKLAQMKLLPSIQNLPDIILCDSSYDVLCEQLKELSQKHPGMLITYVQWSKVTNPLSKKETKISRKISETSEMVTLAEQLLKMLDVMKSHLHRAHAIQCF